MTAARRLSREELAAMVGERAAIMEFDGGMSREDAESAAWDEVLVEVEGLARPPMLCSACGGFGVHALGMCSVCYQRDLRSRHRIKVKRCPACEIEFEASRKDTRFCSATCRMKGHRLAKRLGLSRVGETMADCAEPMTRDTAQQNPNEDPIEKHRRELAEKNDARNAAAPSLIPSIGVSAAVQARMQLPSRAVSRNGRVFRW